MYDFSGTSDTDGCVHCILALGVFLSQLIYHTHYNKIHISTGETWLNKCVKAPYALSVKALCDFGRLKKNML